jgi:hypothetical protein
MHCRYAAPQDLEGMDVMNRAFVALARSPGGGILEEVREQLMRPL